MTQPIANGAGVYLIHLSRLTKTNEKTITHYIGYSPEPKKRTWKHNHKKFLTVQKKRSLGSMLLVRTWPYLDKEFEVSIRKKYKSLSKLCPLCNKNRWHNYAPHPDIFAYE